MSETIKESKTIENAIELALEELSCSREEVKIEVIQEPAKGIFGIVKMAKVKVKKIEAEINGSNTEMNSNNQEVNREQVQKLSSEGYEILEKIISCMAIPQVDIKINTDEDTIIYSIQADSEGLLIGRHGQNLAALQYLLNRVLTHKTGIKSKCVIDVGGYREKHRIILERMAKKIAKKVEETKEEEQLKAMNAFDRRIIHLSIKNNPAVTTYSLGEGNFRRVVITPRKKNE